MKRVEVIHMVDDTVRTDVLEAEEVNAKIKADRTGYVRTPGDERLYARIERIRITGEGGAR